MKRGDVYMVELGAVKGSEQGGTRPMVVIQNDIGNRYSTTVIVACVTSQISKKKMPTHVDLDGQEAGLMKDSVVLCEQVRTIDKSRLIKKVSTLPYNKMKEINNAIAISLGLNSSYNNQREMVTA